MELDLYQPYIGRRDVSMVPIPNPIELEIAQISPSHFTDHLSSVRHSPIHIVTRLPSHSADFDHASQLISFVFEFESAQTFMSESAEKGSTVLLVWEGVHDFLPVCEFDGPMSRVANLDRGYGEGIQVGVRGELVVAIASVEVSRPYEVDVGNRRVVEGLL